MKFLIFVTILAFVACAFACKPESNNKPDCADGSDAPVRNFNDPNYYWVCEGGEAKAVRCKDEKAFDEATGECVPFSEFKYTKPCGGGEAAPAVSAVDDAGDDAVDDAVDE